MTEKEDAFWDTFSGKSPIPQESAEQMLKRLDKKTLEKEQADWKHALSNRTWRTKDGRYIAIDEMDDNHLLNSYNLVERNIKKYFDAAGFDQEEIEEYMTEVKKIGATKSSQVNKALGAQLVGYKYLSEEVVERQLHLKKAEEVFNLFDDIIKSKDDDEA